MHRYQGGLCMAIRNTYVTDIDYADDVVLQAGSLISGWPFYNVVKRKAAI